MKTYKKLFKYIPESKINGYLAILFSGLSGIFTVYGYYFVYLFLEESIVQEEFQNAKLLALKVVFYLTLGAVMYFLSGYFSHKLGFRLETNLRKRGIDGLTDASFRFFDLYPSGVIRKTIDDNAVKTHMAVAHMIPDSAQAFLVPILLLFLGFIISIKVGACIVILTFVCGFILQRMMGNNEFMKLYQESLDTLSSESVEYVRGIPVVKIFGARLDSFKNFYYSIQNYSDYAYKYSLSCKKPYVLYELIFLGFIAFLTIPLSFVLNQVTEPKLFAVELIMIMFLEGLMMVCFMRIMWAFTNIFNANYAVDTLEDLYQKMKLDKLKYGNKTNFENYDIEFENVSFSYQDNKVIDGLSFKLEEGKTYALVGRSGSGKSTIAKLMSGFYKVDEGDIKIGGSRLEEYSKESLINAISFVFQDSKLFKRSIYDNVALADKNATREEVMNAMELAGCNVILEKFREKENTIIGSKGVYLSGGEVQRIAIARAILKKSKIVIMDEASAAIDPDNEHEIQKAFRNLMKGKTVIMIAHRLSSIRSVDEILVLENGAIVERGNDESLMKEDTIYKRLVSLYDSANEWRVGDESIL